MTEIFLATLTDLQNLPQGAALLDVFLGNPTSTTSLTPVMMGFGASMVLTPRTTGRVMVIFTGNMSNSGGGSDGAENQILYGTGAAPANGAAVVGTMIGGNQAVQNTTAVIPFTTIGAASGLALGTQYWFDLDLFSLNGGTAALTNVIGNLIEF